MEGNKLGCPSCGTLDSPSVKNDLGDDLFWIGAPKGTVDFIFYVPDDKSPTGFRETFLGVHTMHFPQIDNDKYDYYCTDCFIKISEENDQLEERDEEDAE